MYFFNPISDEVRLFQGKFKNHKRTMKLILISIFSCIAAILQSAGGFLPGIGYIISPLATAPIVLGSMFSISFGVMAYFLTMGLLLILEPTELIIFPFTTGVLGLGIGISFSLFRRRISIIASGTVLLILGILSLLYIFGFPILGPVIPDSFSLLTFGGISLFAFLYSWLWLEFALGIFKRIKMMVN